MTDYQKQKLCKSNKDSWTCIIFCSQDEFMIEILPRCSFYRSSYPEVFCEKGFFRKFAKFTRKKKRLWHRCLPVNFAKVLRTSFLTKHLRWLLLILLVLLLLVVAALIYFWFLMKRRVMFPGRKDRSSRLQMSS